MRASAFALSPGSWPDPHEPSRRGPLLVWGFISDLTPSLPAPRRSRATTPHLWVSSTYFAEGFPYAVLHQLAEVLFRELGASLQVIGLTSLFHLPYNLKFLWAPLVDGFATKRAWLVAMEAVLGSVLLALAFLASADHVLMTTSVAFAVLALASATHDIAIDGYYLEALDSHGQSKFVGYRAMAYRVATLAVAGPLLVLVGRAGWSWGFLVAALVVVALLTCHALFLPRVEQPRLPFRRLLIGLQSRRLLLSLSGLTVAIALIRALPANVIETVRTISRSCIRSTNLSLSALVALGLPAALLLTLGLLFARRRRLAGSKSLFARAFVDFLGQEQVRRILAFVILFRAGDSLLLKMRYPFLKQAGMTLEQYGWASGTLGVVASFGATLAGGWLVSRHGLRRWIWPMTLGQNVLNLLYVPLALLDAPVSLTWLVLVVTLEAFGSGLGTAAFMVYLMRCCRPEFKAAHMAILTALMSLSFTVAGVTSGFLASWLGYAWYFAISFVATVPSMLLIPWLPHLAPRPPSS